MKTLLQRSLLAGSLLVLALGAAACGDEEQDSAAAPPALTQPESPPAPSSPQEEGVEVGGVAMLPTLSIAENASNAPNLTTLVAAVKAAGLVSTLDKKGPFTVFAPDNNAFAKLPEGTVETLVKPENKKMLTEILTYHVVPGTYTAADLKDGQKLETVQGERVKISKEGDQLSVNGVEILTADVIDKNGVSFIIGEVLSPPKK